MPPGPEARLLVQPDSVHLFINELANDITRGGIHGMQFMPNQTEMFLMLLQTIMLCYHQQSGCYRIS